MLKILFMSNSPQIFYLYSAISEEVSYSQSTDSEHEEEHVDDVIQQKEASFNHQNLAQNTIGTSG